MSLMEKSFTLLFWNRIRLDWLRHENGLLTSWNEKGKFPFLPFQPINLVFFVASRQNQSIFSESGALETIQFGELGKEELTVWSGTLLTPTKILLTFASRLCNVGVNINFFSKREFLTWQLLHYSAWKYCWFCLFEVPVSVWCIVFSHSTVTHFLEALPTTQAWIWRDTLHGLSVLFGW